MEKTQTLSDFDNKTLSNTKWLRTIDSIEVILDTATMVEMEKIIHGHLDKVNNGSSDSSAKLTTKGNASGYKFYR